MEDGRWNVNLNKKEFHLELIISSIKNLLFKKIFTTHLPSTIYHKKGFQQLSIVH